MAACCAVVISAGSLGTATAPWTAASDGARAVTQTGLGAGPRETSSSAADVPPGRTPGATLRAYFQAMAAHNSSPQLALYTPETRQMLAGHVMTPAQMDNLLATYRRCPAAESLVSPDGVRAVIRYPPAARACAPFFFQRLDGHWLLDLTMMQRAIRFDTANRWRFDPAAPHPYGFAFDDWQLDARGYPRTPAESEPR